MLLCFYFFFFYLNKTMLRIKLHILFSPLWNAAFSHYKPSITINCLFNWNLRRCFSVLQCFLFHFNGIFADASNLKDDWKAILSIIVFVRIILLSRGWFKLNFWNKEAFLGGKVRLVTHIGQFALTPPLKVGIFLKKLLLAGHKINLSWLNLTFNFNDNCELWTPQKCAMP